MRGLREWTQRLLGTVMPGRSDDDLAEELRQHAQLAADAARGHRAAADGARAARLRLDGHAQAMDALRDQRGLPWLDDLGRDVRHGFRSLRRTPVVTCVALLTLALGIGATAAIFTLVRSVLLRPLPFPDPETLHVVSYTWPGPAWLYPGMSDRGYLGFRDANRTFESLATLAQAQSTLTGAGEATRISGAAVTSDFFRVLRVSPALGRTFAPEDPQTGSDNTVLIADSLWRRQFGADPAIVGRTIALNGMPYRVAGVLPPGFSYPANASYWIPLTIRVVPNLGYIRPVIGRLKPGVTSDQARADLDRWVRSLPPDPGGSRNLVAQVLPLHEAMVRDVRLPLLVFGGAVALVLSIACANVANLLLMRAVSRRRETAARVALGATRRRVLRQFLTEGAMLSVAGGCLGALTAYLAGPALLSLIPAGRLPSELDVRVDGWILAFTAGLSMLTGVLVGLAPVVQTSRDSLYSALRGGTAHVTRRSHRLQHALVVAEVALTLVLLVGAGLLVRSFISLSGVRLGFVPDRVMTMTVDLPVGRYPTAAQATALHARILQALSGLPGVESAAAVNWLPLGDATVRGDVYADDRPDLAGKYGAFKLAISAGYFDTMGIRLLNGRAFTAEDRAGGLAVAIVSESVARRLWPGRDPIGRRLSVVDRPKPEDWLSVVGVVEDARQDPFTLDPVHAVYQPYEQVTNRFFVGLMSFLVRTSGDPAEAAPMMRAALARIDKEEAPQTVAALETVINRTVAEPQFQARVLAAFSGLALLLAAIGIYGVLAAAVLERRSEIGVRMAFGADRAAVVRMVAAKTLLLTAIGLAMGLAGSLAVTDVLASLLYSVTPTDVATFAVATGVLLAAAAAAAVVPARRASRLDPVQVLRAE